MRATLSLAAAVLALGTALAHAADRREERPVSGFTALVLSAPVDLTLAIGERESLVLEGPEDQVAAVESTVEGGTLRLGMKPLLSFSWGRVRATLTARSIRSLAVAGSGNVASGPLEGESLEVAVTGSGDVRIERLAAQRLQASIVGSGDIRLAGRVGRMGARIEGSGDLVADGLEAKDVRVGITGSGDATVWATESLDVSIAGSGDVRYRGQPRLQRSVAGSGSVRPLGS